MLCLHIYAVAQKQNGDPVWGFGVFNCDITAGLREMSVHHQCGLCHMEFADESKLSTGWLCGGHLPSAGEG